MSDQESNFRIEQIESGTFVVKSDSIRFGKQAITFESTFRNECINYIDTHSEPSKPTYYVIEDLSTWSNNAPIKSILERYDYFVDAISAFIKYRSNVYDYSDSKSKLTLGVSIGNSEVDIIHVRNDNNYLITDFMSSAAINTNRHFINNMMNLNNLIGIERIRYYENNNIIDKEYKDWTNVFYQDASGDDFIRTCNCCKNDMFDGYLFEESGDTYCSDDCLHTEITPEEFLAFYEAGDACWTTFPIPEGYIYDGFVDHALIMDIEQDHEM